MSDLAASKRRLMVMLIVNALCLLAAGGAIAGYVAKDIAILGPAFVAAIAVGVGTQIWFIAGLVRKPTPAGKA